MPRVSINETHNRKKDVTRYIQQLMDAKEMSQADVAGRLGKSQSWMSKKMTHCGFYVGELIDIFKLLDAEPDHVGKMLVITKEKK